MTALNLPLSTISTVVDNPIILGPSTSEASLAALGISPTEAAFILSHGYIRGFRTVFILNAALSALATVVSIFMIRHKELIRGDEEKLRAEAKKSLLSKEAAEKTRERDNSCDRLGDLELGEMTLDRRDDRKI